jgi:tRNA A-37 threonylcarbamoyl transferase component Bud32
MPAAASLYTSTKTVTRRAKRVPASSRSTSTALGIRTVAAARALQVPRVAKVVLEQRRRHTQVLRLCEITPQQVRVLAGKLGVRVPSHRNERVAGAPEDLALRNTCHILGTAMSMLFKGERNYAYPIKVAGSGVAGLAFFMSDGSVIKVAEVYDKGRRPKNGGGLVPGRGRAVPIHEFAHEVVMTRAARRRFADSRDVRVPKVPRVVVLNGPKGARIGVMQQSRAPGVTMAAFLRDTRVPAQTRLAAAEAHGRAVGTLHAAGWAHGDIHTENVLVMAGPTKLRLTVIDWGRSNTRSRILTHAGDIGHALWRKFVRYEVAFPYNDMATHGPGRAFAEAYLRGYGAASGAAKGEGPIGQGLVDVESVRRDYHGLVQNNVNAMFKALDVVAPHTSVRRKRSAKSHE